MSQDIDKERLAKLMEMASPEQRDAVLKALDDYHKGSLKFYNRLEEGAYEEREAPIDEFLFSKEYLYQSRQILFPRIIDLIVAIDDPTIRKAYVVAGKGSGKSSFSSIVLARQVHRLVKRLRDPSAYFRLIPDSLIGVVNMSLNADQAKNVMFRKFWQLIVKAKCFQQPDGSPIFRKVERHIEFPKSVHALSGHSNYRAYFGYDVFAAILDEFSWYNDTKKRSVSEEVHQGVASSMETRFPDDHKLVAISSPQAKSDSLCRRVEEVVKDGTLVKPAVFAEVDGDAYAKAVKVG